MKPLSREAGPRVFAIIVTLAMVAGLGLAFYLPSVAGNDLRFWLIAAWSGAREEQHATAPGTLVSPRVENGLGVNTFLEQEVEPSKRARTLSMARDAGFHWIRQEFRWEEIEPATKGEFLDPKFGNNTWEKYDQIVDTATVLGLEIIARLDTSPPWARPGNRHAFTPPERLDDYGDFVAAVASRYRGRLHYYQIWNEPNLSFEWGNQPVDAVATTELLKVAYTRIKAVDPSAVILAPALAPTLADGPGALNELVFLQQMYDAGAAAYFEIGSVQAYGLRDGPDDRRLGNGDVNFSRPLLFRALMVRNGDAAKPIWISEFGWNVPPPGHEGPYVYGNVTEDQQARYTVRALDRARTEWPWVGVMNLWYLKRADDREAGTLLAGFRLLDPDFTPRPVYGAVRDYAKRVGLL
ncbi:MAG: hypothetical protein EXR58_07405 [Chloroflexi bacterium]|nr:hypothetical protein [Chloroflexota bacterium]